MRPTARDVARLRAELDRIRERRALAHLGPGVSGLVLDGLRGAPCEAVPGRGVRGMLDDARAATEHLADPRNPA